MSAIVSSHRVFDGANHGAPAMYSGASGCSSMQMGPEGLLIKCGFGYSDVSRCIYAPGSSTPASPSGSSPRLRPHRAPVHPELTSHGVHADALCAGCSHSVHFLVGQACSRSFLWFRRRADQRVVGLAVGLCIRANPLIPRGNQPLDPRSPVPTTLHCFHHPRDSLRESARLSDPSGPTLGSTIRATRCASPRARKHDTTSRCDDLMSSAREPHDINSTGAEMMRSPWADRHTPM